MAEVFFISESYLKEMSVITENTDYKTLRPTIILAQDLYLQKKLGTKLYQDLRAKLQADITLSAYPNEKALIDNYIVKVLLWYVLLESASVFKYRWANKGLVVNTDDKSQPTDFNEMKWIMDRLRVNAEQYAQLLTDHLILNTTLFPLFITDQQGGMQPTIRNYTSGIYLPEYGKENQCKKGPNGADYYFY